MSAPRSDDFALLALLDAGNMSPTSCDGTARDTLIAAALGYAKSRGWCSPEQVTAAEKGMADLAAQVAQGRGDSERVERARSRVIDACEDLAVALEILRK